MDVVNLEDTLFCGQAQFAFFAAFLENKPYDTFRLITRRSYTKLQIIIFYLVQEASLCLTITCSIMSHVTTGSKYVFKLLIFTKQSSTSPINTHACSAIFILMNHMGTNQFVSLNLPPPNYAVQWEWLCALRLFDFNQRLLTEQRLPCGDNTPYCRDNHLHANNPCIR